jgi:hypothetical protein
VTAIGTFHRATQSPLGTSPSAEALRRALNRRARRIRQGGPSRTSNQSRARVERSHESAETSNLRRRDSELLGRRSEAAASRERRRLRRGARKLDLARSEPPDRSAMVRRPTHANLRLSPWLGSPSTDPCPPLSSTPLAMSK